MICEGASRTKRTCSALASANWRDWLSFSASIVRPTSERPERSWAREDAWARASTLARISVFLLKRDALSSLPYLASSLASSLPSSSARRFGAGGDCMDRLRWILRACSSWSRAAGLVSLTFGESGRRSSTPKEHPQYGRRSEQCIASP